MRTPTQEQRAILESTDRIRVVRAVPGSGKTWLVAELIRQELSNWSARGAGIAALSFTRVGGDEIRQSVGYQIDFPHFVGTIDAFLFRYVVRTFLRQCYPDLAVPRLIPGEWGAEHWSRYGPNRKATVARDINLFGCIFIDEVDGKAVIARKPHPTQPLQRLTGDDLIREVKQGKLRLWKESGCFSHSDAALWASKVLEHPKFGASIRAEIIRRFPLLIVDELQDTGFFLGKSIRLLLKESSIRSVLVGDPDQAIYEFNGARPDLFGDFESLDGAVVLSLSRSQRCPRPVARAAKHIKDSDGNVEPAEDREGRALLIRCNDIWTDVERIAKIIACVARGRKIKIVARSNQTVENLIGRRSKEPPKLGCPTLNHIQRAVKALRQGRQVAALAAARTAIDVAVFGHEGVSDDELGQVNIAPDSWKALGVRCLLSVNSLNIAGSVFDWQVAAGKILVEELSTFDLSPVLEFKTDKLKPKRQGEWEKPLSDFLPGTGVGGSPLAGIPVQTVHGVKGETHDVTIFVCPDPVSANRSLSSVWWSDNEKDREERRIAYVAMTRTQRDLVLCVPEKTYQQLCTQQPQFVACFECVLAEDFVELFRRGVSAGPTIFPTSETVWSTG